MMPFDLKLPNIFNRKRLGTPNFQMPQIQQPAIGVGQSQYPVYSQPPPMQQQEEQPDWSTPALDAYMKWSGQMPQRTNPGFWGRLGAGLTGTSAAIKGGNGYQTAVDQLDEPYQRNLRDWAYQGEGLKGAATIEGSSNKSYYQNQYNQNRLGLQARGQDITQQNNLAKQQAATTNQTYLDNKLAQSGVADWKTGGSTPDGKLIMVSNRGEYKVLEGVDTSSPLELQQERLANALKVAGIYSSAQITRQSMSDTGAAERQDDRQNFQLENPNIGRAAPQTSAAMTKIYKQDSLLKILSRNPKMRNTVIKQKPTTGELYLAPPEAPGFMGEDLEPLFQQAISELDKLEAGNIGPRSNVAPPRNTGTVVMTDGKTDYNIPASQVNDAIRDGLRRK